MTEPGPPRSPTDRDVLDSGGAGWSPRRWVLLAGLAVVVAVVVGGLRWAAHSSGQAPLTPSAQRPAVAAGSGLRGVAAGMDCLGPASAPDSGSVPDRFSLAIACTTGAFPTGSPRQTEVAVIPSDLFAVLVDAFRHPDTAPSSASTPSTSTCPAVAQARLVVVAQDVSGRWWRLHTPAGACGQYLPGVTGFETALHAYLNTTPAGHASPPRLVAGPGSPVAAGSGTGPGVVAFDRDVTPHTPLTIAVTCAGPGHVDLVDTNGDGIAQPNTCDPGILWVITWVNGTRSGPGFNVEAPPTTTWSVRVLTGATRLTTQAPSTTQPPQPPNVPTTRPPVTVTPGATVADLRRFLEASPLISGRFTPWVGSRVYCGLNVLGRSADRTVDYLWVSCQQYYVKYGNLNTGAAISAPAVLDLATSTLTVVNSGDLYPATVREKFPAAIAERILTATNLTVDEPANVRRARAVGDLLPDATANPTGPDVCPTGLQPVSTTDAPAAFTAVRGYATRHDPTFAATDLHLDPVVIATDDLDGYGGLVTRTCGIPTAGRTLVVTTTRTDLLPSASLSSSVYFVSRIDGTWVVWQQVH